jgi:prepilin-type processing-associated H-X9-DG protein
MKNGVNSIQRRSSGFTMIDLLAVIFIICFLSGVVFSAGGLVRARETANRVKCASNLKQIGLAIMLYSNENKGVYPRTLYKPEEPIAKFTGVECKDPFHGKDTPKVNDISAAMMLLIRTQDITSDVFICPSTDATKMTFPEGKSAQDYGNFKSEENVTYSMINVYPNAKAIAIGYKVNNTVGGEVAIMADMNPGQFGECDVTPKMGPRDEKAIADFSKANSMNHRGAGQNVLFGDGHVEFESNPFCGMKRDNIYTVAGDNEGKITTSETISGAPMWAGDSVLLPAATANPHKKTADQEEAAAVAQFKAMIPKIKEEIAAREKAAGETAETKRVKQQVEAMEKEIADTEARLKQQEKK